MSQYLEHLKNHLLEYLSEYMLQKEIKFAGASGTSFHCPNAEYHKNGDKDASAGIFEHGIMWSCKACGEGGNIFHMSNLLDGYPLKGTDFWTITIPSLLEYLSIDYNKEQYNKELLSTKKISSSYKSISFDKEQEKRIEELINSRKDPIRISEEFGRKNYPNDIKSQLSEEFGIFFPEPGDLDFLEPIDEESSYHPLNDPKVINKGRMVIPIHDIYGKLIAFIARVSEEDRQKANGKIKYYYTKNKLSKFPIGFFNFNKARRDIRNSHVVYIFESQLDAAVAWVSGIRNSISVGSTPDTITLSKYLKDLGVREIVLVLDSDKAGINGMVRMYDSLMETGILTSCILLPENTDVDELIIQQGTDYLLSNKNRKSIVEVILHGRYKDLSNEELSDRARYVIAIEYTTKYMKSASMAEYYAELISNIFGFKSKEDIHHDIIREFSNENDPITIRCNNLIKHMSNKAIEEGNIERKILLIEEGITDIKNEIIPYIISKEAEDINSLNLLLNQHDDKETPRLYTGLESFDSAIRITPGGIVVLSGIPSSGKSLLVKDLVVRMLEHSRNMDKIYIIHITLDDNKQDTMDGLISRISNVDNSIIDNRNIPEQYMPAIAEAQERMQNWWKDSYHLYGQESVKTVKDIQNIVNRIRMLYPEKIILYIVDNLMNISEISESGKDNRVQIENAINGCHRITQYKENISGIVLVELTKSQKRRPHIQMLKGTRTIEYRARLVGLLHNDMKEDPNSTIYWVDEYDNKWPYLEINIPKYKKGSPNNLLIYKIHPPTGRLIEPTNTEIQQVRAIIDMQESKDSKPKSDDNFFF